MVTQCMTGRRRAWLCAGVAVSVAVKDLILQPHFAEFESSLVVADFGAVLVFASPP